MQGSCITLIYQGLEANSKQKIYHRTHFDASVRFGCLLEGYDVHIDEFSILRLLHFASIPSCRDKIETIFVYRSRTVDKSRNTYLDQEDNEAYMSSPELIYLLAECFRKLEKAKSLDVIQIRTAHGHDSIFRALNMANFPRKIVTASVHTKTFEEQGYGAFSESPSTYAAYVKGLQIQEPLAWHRCKEIRPAAPTQELRDQLVDNKEGYHVRAYRPNYPHFADSVKTMTGIERLELNGCDFHPRLRICNGCHDLFMDHFTGVVFNHLTSLYIGSIYISGGRLRSFLKLQTKTLAKVSFFGTKLTDGTWRSIAQGLVKLEHLEELTFVSRLYQKHEAHLEGHLPHSLTYVEDASECFQPRGPSDVQRCLTAFVQHFHTRMCTHHHTHLALPTYHEVRLFMPRDVPSVPGSWHAVVVQDKYAAEVL
jgi:hypothetical protein